MQLKGFIDVPHGTIDANKKPLFLRVAQVLTGLYAFCICNARVCDQIWWLLGNKIVQIDDKNMHMPP